MEHSQNSTQNYSQTQTRNQVQEVKDAIDIVQLIGERVHLARAGKSFKGLCPFHSEKSPSFFVTSDIQRYKCFGCGKSGDVFTFLEEYESMTFAEALQELASRAGITLERHVFTNDDLQRQRLYEILSLTREYYHYILTEHKSGKSARDYLQSRGVASETITTFKLGYALDSWDALQHYLVNKKKYTETELLNAGLLVQGNSNRPYDRFRGRVIFPLTDALGKVVGFSGRVLDPKAKEAKYINSPETQLYHKSELLFGYSILKPIIKKEEDVFVVEGELDALSSYQAGVKNVVAIKGSALSDQQMRLLSRTAKRVVLALDADNAGVEATIRAIEVANPFELSVRVLPIEGGKDPDEIARESPKAWRELTKHTVSAFEFLINAAFVGQDQTTGEGKKLIAQKIVPVLASIGNAVEQAFFLQKASEKLEVRPDVLETEVKKYVRKKELGSMSQYAQKSHQKDGNTANSPNKQEKQEFIVTLQRYLLSLALHGNQEFVLKAVQDLLPADFTDPPLKNIWSFLEKTVKKGSFAIRIFTSELPEELQPMVSEIFLEQELVHQLDDEVMMTKEWGKTLETYREHLRKHARTEVAQRFAELETLSELSKDQQWEYDTLLKQMGNSQSKKDS